jgi:Planctomycete cytochrome C
MPFKTFPFLFGLISLAAGAQAASAPAKADFERDIAPLLKAHCFECHTGDEPEGDLHLGFKNGAEAVERARKERAIFEKMAEVLRHREMPPEDFKAQPTDQSRQRLIAWIENDLLAPDPKSVGTPGQATSAQRLNSVEVINPDALQKHPAGANTTPVSKPGLMPTPRGTEVRPPKIPKSANGQTRAHSPTNRPLTAVTP